MQIAAGPLASPGLWKAIPLLPGLPLPPEGVRGVGSVAEGTSTALPTTGLAGGLIKSCYIIGDALLHD